MPYLITTHPSDDVRTLPEPDTFAEHDAQQEALITRRAVATLEADDLRRACKRAQPAMIFSAERMAQIHAAIESGSGTVGPLPDGTVIEVEPVGWATLRGTAGPDAFRVELATAAQLTEIIDAYNTRQATS